MRVLLVTCLLFFLSNSASGQSWSDEKSITKQLEANIKQGYSFQTVDLERLQRLQFSIEKAKAAVDIIESPISRVQKNQLGIASRNRQRSKVMELEIASSILEMRMDAVNKATAKWNAPVYPVVEFEEIEIGKMYVFVSDVKVADVVDGRTVHVTDNEYRRVCLLLSEEKARYNDQQFKPEGFYLASGVKKYSTVAGGTNSIPALVNVTEQFLKIVQRDIPAEDRKKNYKEDRKSMIRTWKSANYDHSTEGYIEDADEESVTLNINGRSKKISLTKLSVADQMYVGSYLRALSIIETDEIALYEPLNRLATKLARDRL